MELWDLYTIDRKPLGLTMERGGRQPDNTYRTVVHICIFNSQNRMIIQRRQPTKKDWPGYWDVSAGGSAICGENSQTAAARETFEELGLTLDLSRRQPAFTGAFKGGYDDFYVVRKDTEPSKLRLQAEEVAEVRLAALDEINQMIDTGLFIPYNKNLIALLFSINENGRVII